jgi:hypothetical protein
MDRWSKWKNHGEFGDKIRTREISIKISWIRNVN